MKNPLISTFFLSIWPIQAAQKVRYKEEIINKRYDYSWLFSQEFSVTTH